MRKHIVIFFGVALCAAVLLVFKATSNKDESVNYTPLISQETMRYGVSQFQQAIIDSNIERVEWCLDRGANVEHRIPSAYYLRCPQIMTHDAYENIDGYQLRRYPVHDKRHKIRCYPQKVLYHDTKHNQERPSPDQHQETDL